MKCAIIVAAFNAQRYILQCLDSIGKQKPLPGWEYELRVGVDGCQTTAATLQRAKRKFYFTPNNRGSYLMANSLIALGPADMYSRFDADDYMLPDYMATVIRVALDYGIAFAGHVVRPDRFSKPRVGQVTFTADTLDKLGGFHAVRCHGDRDFARRAALAGLDIQKMRADERLQKGLFLKNLAVDSLTHCPRYGYKSAYRRKVRDELAALRIAGNIKIKPEAVELSCQPS
jgi:glycosyltransferase involved in cell wall biosynthesis